MNLEPLLRAMHDGSKLQMIYQRYEADAAKEYKTACPYCLKLHNRRWYVLMEIEDGTGCHGHTSGIVA